MSLHSTPLRSVLYVPASNPRALEKAASLACDAVIFDLEDAVLPDQKPAAREALRTHFLQNPAAKKPRAIRINGLETQWGTEDLLAARACMPDVIVIPKVDSESDILAVQDALAETDAPSSLRLWAMIESARGVINAPAIAQMSMGNGRLEAFVVGTNDLVKETGLDGAHARKHAHGWLMQIVLAGKAGGLAVLDGVYNDFADAEGFERQCAEGAQMGFDGKTLIHPKQIAFANEAFAPMRARVEEAKAIVAAFDQPENAGKGVIALDGKMVERLHLSQARALLARHEMIIAANKL